MAAEFDKLIIQLEAQNRGVTATLHEVQQQLKGLATTLDRASQPLTQFNRQLNTTASAATKKATDDIGKLKKEINSLASRYTALGQGDVAKRLRLVGASLGKGLREQQEEISKQLNKAGFTNASKQLGGITDSVFNKSGAIPEQSIKDETVDTEKLSRKVRSLAQEYKKLGDIKRYNELSAVAKSISASGLDSKTKGIISELNAAGLTTSADKVGAATSMFNAEPVKKFNEETKKAASNIKKVGAESKTSFFGVKNLFGLSKLLIGFHAVQRAGRVMASFFHEAINYVETLNLFSTALGGNLSNATDFVGEMSSKLGLSETTLMKYQGLFYQMTTSMGLANQQAYLLSENFTKLANDIASYYNISVSSANEKLQSALAGQIRPLRELGIDISKTALQEEARLRGITESIEKMTQAEKVQLRYLAVMRQTTNAQGDFVKQIDTAAVQLKILSEQTKEAKRAWGEVLMPILQAILPIVNGLVMGFTQLGKAMSTVFGYKAIVNAGTLNGLNALDVDAEEATDSLNALKKATTGIDELNILSDNSGSALDTGNWALDLTDYNNGLGQTEEIINKIGGVGKTVYDAFNLIGNTIKTLTPLIQGVGIALLAHFGVKAIQGLGFLLFKNLIKVNFTTPLDASLDVTKAATKQMSSFGTAIGGLGSKLKAFIAANWLTLLIAGVSALYMHLKKTSDEKVAEKVAKNLDGLRLSAGELDRVIGDLNPELATLYGQSSAAKEKLKPIQEGMDEATKASDKFWLSLDRLDGDIAGQVDNVTKEVDKLTLAMQTGFADKHDIILSEWERMFQESGGRIDSDEQALLDKLKLQGTGVESVIQDIGTRIKEIYAQMATDASGSVDEQIKEIAKLQDVQWRLANTDVLIAQDDARKARQQMMDDIEAGKVAATGEGSYEDLANKYLSSLEESVNQFNTLKAAREQDIKVAKFRGETLKEAGYTEEDLAKWGYDSKTISEMQSELDKWADAQRTELGDTKLWNAIKSGLENSKDNAEKLKSWIGIKRPDWVNDVFAFLGESDAQDYKASKESDKEIDKLINEILSRYGNIKPFATGGYPDRGELFRANEGGAIEAMGTVGGRTAVMNNQTLANAFGNEIAPILSNAVTTALRGGTSGGSDIVIQIDGREIARAAERGNRLNSANFSTASGSAGIL